MKKILISCLLLAMPFTVFAQLKVNSDGTACVGRTTSFGSSTLSVGNNTPVLGSGNMGINSQIRTVSVSNVRNIGIFGLARSTTTHQAQTIGIMGYGYNGYSGKLYGVIGAIQSGMMGAGVYGTTGAYGTIYGNTLSGTYAGYFEGATYVNGSLTATEVITPSDINLKENIVSVSDEESSLDNLMEMNVIKYNYKPKAYTPKTEDEQSLYEDKEAAAKAEELAKQEIQRMAEQKHYGLSAQELQKIYPDLVRESQDGTLGVNYVELVPILIRSIQELKQELDDVKAGGNARQTRSISDDGQEDYSAAISKNVLYQNTPNPFKEQTTIRFRLADDARDASICIFDLSGKMLRKLPVSQGMSSVTIGGYELGEGLFLYSLVVNGREIDTKRMIITK
jgi:hypothetical protein